MSKDGGRVAMDYYFYQINRAAKPGGGASESTGANPSAPGAEPTVDRRVAARRVAARKGSTSERGAEP
jgi:hypothetical protein